MKYIYIYIERIVRADSWLVVTILSQASAHGHSQLKRQKVRVGGYTEKVLKMVQLSLCKGPPQMRS